MVLFFFGCKCNSMYTWVHFSKELISFLIWGPSREYDGRFLLLFFVYMSWPILSVVIASRNPSSSVFVWIPFAKLVIHENDVPAKARNNGIIRGNIVRRRWEIVELEVFVVFVVPEFLFFLNTIFFVSVFESCRYWR